MDDIIQEDNKIENEAVKRGENSFMELQHLSKARSFGTPTEQTTSEAKVENDFQSTKDDSKLNQAHLTPYNSTMENNVGDGSQWRCVCEDGFLPPGLRKSFGMMESMIRTSTGRCYHKSS